MNQAFDAVLEVRFRQCPGHRKIARKEYALRSRTQKKNIERIVDFRRCLFPGQRVEMSMIFERDFFDMSVCPGCKIPAPESEDYQEPEIEWYNSLSSK